MFKLIKNLTTQSKIAIVIFVLALFGYWIYSNSDSFESAQTISQRWVSIKADKATNGNSITHDISQKLSQEIQSGTLIEVNDSFKSTLFNEASTLNKPLKDQEILEDQLKAKAQNFSPQESFYLAQMILDLNSTANLKVYSAYLLSLAPRHNLDSINFILDQPMLHQPGVTHSPEETLFMQEKAIRKMLQDSLSQIENQ